MAAATCARLASLAAACRGRAAGRIPVTCRCCQSLRSPDSCCFNVGQPPPGPERRQWGGPALASFACDPRGVFTSSSMEDPTARQLAESAGQDRAAQGDPPPASPPFAIPAHPASRRISYNAQAWPGASPGEAAFGGVAAAAVAWPAAAPTAEAAPLQQQQPPPWRRAWARCGFVTGG